MISQKPVKREFEVAGFLRSSFSLFDLAMAQKHTVRIMVHRPDENRPYTEHMKLLAKKPLLPKLCEYTKDGNLLTMGKPILRTPNTVFIPKAA